MPAPPLPAALPDDISDDEAPPPLPDREPPASPETLHGLARLYRLVSGRELSDRLTEAAASAPASAVDDAVKLLDLIRRGLNAYRDLKTKNAGKAAKFRVALVARLKDLDASLLDLLHPAEPVTEVKADEHKGGDLKYVNGEVAYQWSAWDWEIGAGRFLKISPQALFKAIRDQTIQRLNDDLAEHRGLKYNLNLDVRYYKEEKEGRVTQTIGHITKTAILLTSDDTAEQVDAAFADLATKSEEFEAHGGSGWIFDTCERLVISGNPWRPIRGKGFVKTPPALAKKKAIVNVKNSDDMCFLWAVLAGLNPRSVHPERA